MVAAGNGREIRRGDALDAQQQRSGHRRRGTFDHAARRRQEFVPQAMRAAIITAPRPGGASYLERTIRQITRWMPTNDVRVFSDTLEGPATIEGVPVTYATPEHLELVRRVECLGSLNFARAADWVGEVGHGCVFEDDVELAEQWHARADALAHRADGLYPRGWVLALLHFFRFPADFDSIADLPPEEVQLLYWKQAQAFYGAQAMMLSRRTAVAIGPMIREHIETAPARWLNDLAIRDYCLKTATPLLACHPCLAQHVGEVSTFAIGRPPPVSTQFARVMRHPDPGAGVAAGTVAADAGVVLPNPVRAVGRNAPCPCRSGLRYKECHGILHSASTETQVATRMRAAQASLAAGDLEVAEAHCREVLARIAEHPEALRMLARCEYERGQPGESLQLALRAARALESCPLPPDRAFPVWTDVNFMFTQALTGLDGEFAARKRVEYARRPQTAMAAMYDPQVTVVIVDGGDAHGTAASLASVSQQTWRNVELVVAAAGTALRDDDACVAAVRDCPFPIRWLSLPGVSHAALADAGVRAAGGSLVNVLPAGHEFAPTRLVTMVRAMAAQSGDWGFSGVAFGDAAGHPVGPEHDERVGAWAERLTAIPEADTIGYAFIHQVFVAVDAGNLFFSRSRHRAGGFRDLAHTWAWDFCMRALWLAEPVHVPSAEYRHRVSEAGAGASGPAGEPKRRTSRCSPPTTPVPVATNACHRIRMRRASRIGGCIS